MEFYTVKITFPNSYSPALKTRERITIDELSRFCEEVRSSGNHISIRHNTSWINSKEYFKNYVK